MLTDTQRCRRSVQRAKYSIQWARQSSPTPAIGNRLNHITTKIKELEELLLGLEAEAST